MIKSLDTVYNGYKFRSRLEARWAVFFDSVGIKYEYEKEGFDLNGIYYLPDFWLPELNTFIEIKGEAPTKEEIIKCRLLAENTGKRVYLLDGEIPYPKYDLDNNMSDGFYDIMYNKCWTMYFDEGEDHPYVFCECFVCGKIGIEFDGRSDRICQKCPSSKHGDKGYNWFSSKLENAYRKARSFRFEHRGK